MTVLWCSALVMCVVSYEPIIKNKIPFVILYLGEASYVLYLFHPLVAPLVPQVIKLALPAVPPVVAVIGCLVISIIAASIIHTFIEKPLSRIIKPYIPHAS